MAKRLIKRKHTDNHPAVYGDENGRIRNKILSKLYSQDSHKMGLDEYYKYCEELSDELNMSYVPKYWYKKFPKYVKLVTRGKTKYLVLTRVGRNIVKIIING